LKNYKVKKINYDKPALRLKAGFFILKNFNKLPCEKIKLYNIYG